MRKLPFVLCLGMFASVVSSSCGSSSGGTCGNAAACGGDIVGAWTIQSSCVSEAASMFDDSCPTAALTASNLKATGSVAYKADLTYAATTSLSGSVTVHLPASCLSAGAAGTLTCDQLNQTFAANPVAGISFHCTGTSDCSCVETLTNVSSNTTGTYTTTAAGVVTETSSSGSTDESDFCVKGNTLTISPHAGSTMMGQSVSGTVTLTKS